MSWKKNVVSYLFWFIYTLMSGGVTVALAAMLCREAGVEVYWGGFLAVLYIGIVAGVVFLLHHAAVKPGRNLLLLLESVLVILFMALGLVLRIQNIGDAGGQAADYYEAAKVAIGQEIPYMTHGAVYFYEKMLRGLFSLLGNNFIVGIWAQIALQFVASFILYVVLRVMVGRIAALVTFGFCTCAPYMVRITLVMSPEMLYFLLFVIVVGLVAAVCRGKRLSFQAFFAIGVLAAICCYLDVVGSLLLILALAAIFCRREEMPGIEKRMKAVALCLAGAALGFSVCIFMESGFRGTTFQRVLQEWALLYRPESFRIPFVMAGRDGLVPDVLTVSDSVPESLLLCGLMVFGIFSFWRDRRREYMTPYVMVVSSIVLAGCFGIFTEEISGGFYLYLFLVVLAGLSLGQCFHAVPLAQAEEADSGIACQQEDENVSGANAYQRGEAKEQKTISEETDCFPQEEEQGEKVEFLENPLPLPKKHVKRALDYTIKAVSEEMDYDYAVGEEDDFDI